MKTTTTLLKVETTTFEIKVENGKVLNTKAQAAMLRNIESLLKSKNAPTSSKKIAKQ